ncbi:hypothetical protein [Dactylosporangium sp. NPDC050588]|uniref:hypothetical protein n=1 Tax=Dactylosporangium sp. NPDC050588 TaxID=3157211 RepID=UPI0033C5F7D9
MDRDRFWEAVEAARARVDDVDGVPDALVALLRDRPLAELVAFREVRGLRIEFDEGTICLHPEVDEVARPGIALLGRFHGRALDVLASR